MREDTVVQLRQPGSFEDDPLTEVLRLGARRLLGQDECLAAAKLRHRFSIPVDCAKDLLVRLERVELTSMKNVVRFDFEVVKQRLPHSPRDTSLPAREELFLAYPVNAHDRYM